MPTYRCVVEYDGSAFHGFQYQPDLKTVAGALEAALAPLFRAPVKVTAAGRTDAGVHASGQVISFSAEHPFPIERLALALNATLPRDCCVRDVAIVADGFSARFDARERVYNYLILNRRTPSALWRQRAWHVVRPIDDALFAAAAAPLVGTHDFVAFCGELPENGGHTVREVYAIELERDGDGILRIVVRGNAFLHRMVRVIVGTLTGSATGYRDPDQAARALAARDRTLAGETAPAHGLYFAGVRYADIDTYRPVRLAP